MNHHKELNFDIVAVSDIWKLRREEGAGLLKQKMAHDVQPCVNNDALYNIKGLDAVMISTADFQHALHTIEAVKAGCDVYTEKPFAETMDDAIAALKAVFYTGGNIWSYYHGRTYLECKSAGTLAQACFGGEDQAGRYRLETLFNEPPL
jgi:predicted dehydrogenase